jgi:topoisomerase-4 subunit A
VITQIPFSTNTTTLIDSILKANEKVKSKSKNRRQHGGKCGDIDSFVPRCHQIKPLMPYLFYRLRDFCSAIRAVIEDNKPLFVGVSHMLKISTERTQDLLRQELEIQLEELKINGIFLP